MRLKHPSELTNTHLYFPAIDYVGLRSSSTSPPVVVDTSPPVLTGQAVKVQVQYSSTPTLHVDWTGVFTDQESGMYSTKTLQSTIVMANIK